MVKKVFFTLFIVFGYSIILQAQKSKVIAIYQLIETGKYEEAKKAIEEAINDDKTKNWPRTWYTRGLLTQTAYEKGIKNNNKKQYELYPDQLYVALESYEKALKLDKRGRIDAQLEPQFVLLANDFQKLGEKHYNNKKFEEAFKAFEKALEIYRSSVLSVEADNNLIYNTALAAYESKNWDKATEYFNLLNKRKYSPNVSHLLYSIYLEKSDTIAAGETLLRGINHYEDNENLVLLLADLLYSSNQSGMAVQMLDSISAHKSENYIFPYTKGLIYQKTEQYEDAIKAYEEALRLSPEEFKLYANIGTCYFNIGAEYSDNARSIKNNNAFLAEKAKSAVAYQNALTWLEKANDKDPDNGEVLSKLYQLYKLLGKTDKIKSLEDKFR